MLVIAGTRPECIKLAPVVRELARRHELAGVVVNSGQHLDAVRRTFAEFDIEADIELPALPAQSNLGAASRHLVHGSRRSSGMCGRRWSSCRATRSPPTPARGPVPVRVSRSGTSKRACARRRWPIPFPKSGSAAASRGTPDFHFAPSASAQRNLLAEGTPAARVHNVGNTGIDSLRRLLAHHALLPTRAHATRNQVLVTLHRRENWDGKADIICDALIALGAARPNLRMLVPVHPNPRIAPRIRHRLGGQPQFTLVPPMNYREFVAAAAAAALIVSDSGGIQEEVPHLGVPLLVPRSCTERPEAVERGFVRLVAVDRDIIVAEALALLAAPPSRPLPFDHDAPFGDGAAAVRIVDVLEAALVDAVAA